MLYGVYSLCPEVSHLVSLYALSSTLDSLCRCNDQKNKEDDLQ